MPAEDICLNARLLHSDSLAAGHFKRVSDGQTALHLHLHFCIYKKEGKLAPPLEVEGIKCFQLRLLTPVQGSAKANILGSCSALTMVVSFQISLSLHRWPLCNGLSPME